MEVVVFIASFKFFRADPVTNATLFLRLFRLGH